MKLPFDRTDLILLIGLFILGGGLWLYYELGVALCVVGAIVSVMAIIGAIRN